MERLLCYPFLFSTWLSRICRTKKCY